MTKKELAKILKISRPTLDIWIKEKPELMKLIKKGFLFDKLIEEKNIYLKKIKEIEAKNKKEDFEIKDLF